MDPSNLMQLLNSQECEHKPNEYTNGKKRCCTVRKYLKLFVEILLILAFVIEISKVVQNETTIIEKVKMIGRLFNSTIFDRVNTLHESTTAVSILGVDGVTVDHDTPGQ